MNDNSAIEPTRQDLRETKPISEQAKGQRDEIAPEGTTTIASILVPGETCWRIETADRIGVLIDVADYFGALRQAIAAARSHVMIIGWDVDSRTSLTPEKRPADGLPARLLPFLKAMLRRRPELHVYIVAWDFSVIYALEREFLPSYTFSHVHPRLHFVLDGSHAVGASHHQKLVVIDDRLAFVGGVDLTIRRWDRMAHDWHDKERVDPDGEPYGPMHDVQLCLDGAAAHALGELARARLEQALTHHTTEAPASGPQSGSLAIDPWPASVQVDFLATPVGICRTYAGTLERPRAVREVEALTRAALLSAERYVYIENQYLTATVAAAAILESLQRPEGPEIVVVLPKVECGWLEQSSMGMLRARVLEQLRCGDRCGRLHLYYPKLPDDGGKCLNVHSKLIIVDGRLLKVGSANLSNRSLGLDSECDVTIEAPAQGRGAARTRAGIDSVLQRLLAEHLDLRPTECAAHFARGGSLVTLIESRRGHRRCLEPLPAATPAAPIDLAALGDWVVDPERPMAAETFIQGLFPTELRHPLLRSALASLAMLAPVLVLSWLCHAHAGATLRGALDYLRHVDHAAAYVAASYVLGGLLFVPISLLLAATVVVFDPYHAFVYGLLGTLLAATLAHAVGRTWRKATLRYLREQHVRQLYRGLREQAFRATVLARLIPAGNFTASNLLAGALNLAFGRFLLGNLVGLAFGIAWLVIFARRVAVALNQPSLHNVSAACITAAAMLGLCFALAHWFARSTQTDVAARASKAERDPLARQAR